MHVWGLPDGFNGSLLVAEARNPNVLVLAPYVAFWGLYGPGWAIWLAGGGMSDKRLPWSKILLEASRDRARREGEAEEFSPERIKAAHARFEAFREQKKAGLLPMYVPGENALKGARAYFA